jgi:hypothetical protein
MNADPEESAFICVYPRPILCVTLHHCAFALKIGSVVHCALCA